MKHVPISDSELIPVHFTSYQVPEQHFTLDLKRIDMYIFDSYSNRNFRPPQRAGNIKKPHETVARKEKMKNGTQPRKKENFEVGFGIGLQNNYAIFH